MLMKRVLKGKKKKKYFKTVDTHAKSPQFGGRLFWCPFTIINYLVEFLNYIHLATR